MSGSLKLGLTIIATVVALMVVGKILIGLWHLLWGVLIPLAVIAGIGLVLYGLFSRKALGGSRRYLP